MKKNPAKSVMPHCKNGVKTRVVLNAIDAKSAAKATLEKEQTSVG